MTDPTHDTLTITDELKVTRGEDGDIHIVGSSEGVTVPSNAVRSLQSALEAFKETPATDPKPTGLMDAMQEESDAGAECPKCGSELIHEMGSEAKRCPSCGWVEGEE